MNSHVVLIMGNSVCNRSRSPQSPYLAVKLSSVLSFHTKTGRKCKKESCVQTKPEFHFCRNDYFKILRQLSDLIFRSIFFYRLSFLLRCREARQYITFSSSFTSAYFSPTRYSMFVVHLVFVLWSFTLLVCRVVYQSSGPHMKPCSTDDTPL